MHDTTVLSSSQKAAAILVALGRENGAKLLSHFEQDEIRNLMTVSRDLNGVPQETLEELVAEFEEEFAKGAGLLDSSRTIQSIVEEALTPEQIDELSRGPDAVDIGASGRSAWEIIEEVEVEDLCTFLIAENPQVSAFILARMPTTRSASIVAKLEREARRRIVACMITARPALSGAVDMIEKQLLEQFSRAIGGSKGGTGQRLVAGMFNELDETTSETLFEELTEAVPPEELQSVKSLMFKFGDIVHLDNAARALVFDQVATETTTLALRDVTPLIKDAALSALGQRTRRMLESELETSSNATAEEIKKAQKEIASLVLRLAEKGELTIPQPGAEPDAEAAA